MPCILPFGSLEGAASDQSNSPAREDSIPTERNEAIAAVDGDAMRGERACGSDSLVSGLSVRSPVDGSHAGAASQEDATVTGSDEVTSDLAAGATDSINEALDECPPPETGFKDTPDDDTEGETPSSKEPDDTGDRRGSDVRGGGGESEQSSLDVTAEGVDSAAADGKLKPTSGVSDNTPGAQPGDELGGQTDSHETCDGEIGEDSGADRVVPSNACESTTSYAATDANREMPPTVTAST